MPSNSEASSQPSLHTTPSNEFGSNSQLSLSTVSVNSGGFGDFAGFVEDSVAFQRAAQGTSSDLQETHARAHTHIVEIQECTACDFLLVSRKGAFPKAHANRRIGGGGMGRVEARLVRRGSAEQEIPLRSPLERSESGTVTDTGQGVWGVGGKRGGETGTQKSKDENHSQSPIPSTHKSPKSSIRKMSCGDIQVSSLISLFSSPPAEQRSPMTIPRLSEDNSNYGEASWDRSPTPGCACVLPGCASVLCICVCKR